MSKRKPFGAQPKIIVYCDVRTIRAFDKVWKERGKKSRSATIKELMVAYGRTGKVFDAIDELSKSEPGAE